MRSIMRGMKNLFGSNKLRKKYFVLVFILVVFSTLTLFSYSYFVLATGKYKATDLLITELTYGLTITEDGTEISTIKNNVVTVPAGQKAYFYAEVTSANKIDSKFTLAYNATNDAIVQYTDRTPWKSQGYINSFESSSYTKRIRVVIDNEKESDDVTVTFKVYGGYSFNDYVSIQLEENFVSVSGPYKEVVASLSNKLVDLVEESTGCVTASSQSKSCLYSGGALNNYLQYPEDEDKKQNIWRVLGTYEFDNGVYAKLISEKTGSTSVTKLSDDLKTFYNTLESPDNIILNTKKFNCSNTGCVDSNYSKIGLISTSEYNNIGGADSYLEPVESYFGLDNSSIKNITKDGIVGTDDSTSSGLRPSVYLQTDVKVTGSGTIDDPYIVSPRSDINLVAYTVNGSAPNDNETFNWLLSNKVVNTITCENQTKAEWNYSNNSITLTEVHVPDYCTINFKDGYVVTLTAENGTVNSPGSVSVGENGTATFTARPAEGYTTDDAYVICEKKLTGNVTTESDGNAKVTINNVTHSDDCEIKFQPEGSKVLSFFENKFKNAGNRSNFTAVDTTAAIHKEDGEYTEDIDNDGKGETVYYWTGNVIDNWVQFGQDKSGTELWWRIIRTNEDGSLRLLYHGTGHNVTNAYIESPQAYNTNYNNTMYVGYMYGTTGNLSNNRTTNKNQKNDISGQFISSPIKKTIDKWYEENLKAKDFDKYISKTAIYCNDRSGGNYQSSGTMYYAAYNRLYNKNHPSFKCGLNTTSNGKSLYNDANVADKFSASDKSGGNGNLKYPIALMTADEIVYAGGLWATNSQSYYYYNSSSDSSVKDKYWWTMSPFDFNGSYAFVFFVRGDSSYPGRLYYDDVFDSSFVVRPVISLKSCVQLSGSGTTSSPYKVASISSSCESADN